MPDKMSEKAGSAGRRRVRLMISGKQTDPDGNTQESTSLYEADYSVWEGCHRFSYRAEDGTDAVLLLTRDLVRMEKKDTEMVFDPSVPVTGCAYATPFGTIPMEIRTEGIRILAGQTGELRARVKYRLVMDPAYMLSCSVTIRILEDLP